MVKHWKAKEPLLKDNCDKYYGLVSLMILFAFVGSLNSIKFARVCVLACKKWKDELELC